MGKQRLRPIERTILRLRDDGMSTPEIGRRIGKRPGTVERILLMIDYKREHATPSETVRSTFTPLERVVMRLLRAGENYGEIGVRLGRSGSQIRRIEGYAYLKST